MTCVRTQGFLAKRKITVASQVDARKAAMNRKDALALASQMDEIYVAKGKRVVHVDLKADHPDEKGLAELLLGPTGNLRAPTLRMGRTLVVGFDEATYKKVFG
jgi:arsenate reductase-like glutaredoxin family protein